MYIIDKIESSDQAEIILQLFFMANLYTKLNGVFYYIVWEISRIRKRNER